ncbi:MAG TPA: DUF2252 domain-containing protein [Solirubrobacteraceae bacterium]|nr:DUF2252 domain-containing protein [Solirubrobacteraceae bacterium]
MASSTHATLQSGESSERGRAARQGVPRSVHGDWAPAADRPDPVSVLAAQAASRVQELVPIRYGRMLVSPFTFYRGAAAVMAADLAVTPNSGIAVQACGDAHISNFGGFAAPDRRLVFGPNDFDETLPGPWEWDVKRMAASAEIAGRDVGLSEDLRQWIVRDCVREYREGMRGFANESHLDVWYDRLTASELVERFGGRLGAKGRIVFAKPFAKARRKTSLRAVKKLTERVDGELRFRSVPPLLIPLRELFEPGDARDESDYVRELLDEYAASLDVDRRYLFGTYRFVDMARKVVGVGSVGTRAWVFLLVGRDGKDPLVLQAKEAQASVLEPYLGASEFANNGERVVQGQRLSHAASDTFLGWQRSQGLDGQEHDFYVRQLWDWKASADLSTMNEWGLHAYTRSCGWSLARAHARSGDRLAIAAYLGAGTKFDRAIADFSRAYADQNELDYQRLADSVAAGEVVAEIGV